jgi:predicted nuclease of predicted toxin-antitoxin system
MRFLIDAQLPPGLARYLMEQGHEAEHVADVGLRDAEDTTIWDYAASHGASIITKDEDFATRVALGWPGPALVWLRVGNCSKRALLDWLIPLFPGIVADLERGERLVEVV